MEQKSQAIDILLSFSGTPESRIIFKTTDIIKELLRILHVIGDEKDQKVRDAIMECRVKSLKCLINFSQDEFFMK